MYKKEVLSNNLRIISNELKDRESVSIGIWAGVGGRFEDEKTKGAAHFLEHILFRGSLKYSCTEIKGAIEGVGGALNAFTGEDQTCYYAKVPAKHFQSTLDILSDMVFFPLIQKNDLERERSIILEEIKMYQDLPQYLVLEHLDALVWPDHPLGQHLAGTPETVGSLSQTELRRFHRQYYAADNVVVSVCGNFSHGDAVSILDEKLENFKPAKRPDAVVYKGIQTKPRFKLHRKQSEQTHMAIGFPAFKFDHPDIFSLAVLNVILGGNMSSRLFDEVREKRGLAYSIYSTTKSFDDTGLFMVKAGVDNKKTVEALELILKVLRQVKRGVIKEKEFIRAREYFLGQFILALEDTMDHMMWVGESLIRRNRIRTLGEVVYQVNALTPDDIVRVAGEVIKERRLNLAIVGGFKEDQEVAIRKMLEKTV